VLSRRVPMPRLPPEQAVQSFSEVIVGYSRDEAQREAERAVGADLAASSAACPFGVDVDRLVADISAGEFDRAKAGLLAAHPWPGLLGRWCRKYCESAQRPPEGTESFFVSALERAAATHGEAALPALPPITSGKRVAILGAGSAGSAASYRLRQLGHAVAMFDRLPLAGGMMAMGYPEFRLPLDLVREEDNVRAWGVDAFFDREIDAEVFARLYDEYDAIVIATGKVKEARLDVSGEDLEGVWDALDVLTRVKLGRSCPIGKDVAVFGAGYTAQDASRTARRLGRNVTIYYRRTKDEMPVAPAQRDRYVDQQQREGAPYVFQTAPVRVLGRAGRVVGVQCVKTEPGPPDASGRSAAIALPGSEFVVACDTVFVATGESLDVSYAPALARTERGDLRIDPETFATSLDRVYAVGAAAGFPSTDAAFSSGLRCGESIDRQLLVGRMS